jgi:hypothetical protein
MLDAHPFEPRPNRVEFACARQAADVVGAPIRARALTSGKPVSSLTLPATLPHPAQRLTGLKPEPPQREHPSPSWRKQRVFSSGMGDGCAIDALDSVVAVGLPPFGPGLGVRQHRRGRFSVCRSILAVCLYLYNIHDV